MIFAIKLRIITIYKHMFIFSLKDYLKIVYILVVFLSSGLTFTVENGIMDDRFPS
jgi:hypothetical protein